MSVTFWMPQAPVERVEFDPVDWPGDYEIRPVAPFMEINMTAGNAYAILELISPEDLHVDEDPCGTWGMDKLAKVRTRVIKLINGRAEVRAQAYLASQEAGGPGTGTCRVLAFGRDMEYIDRRLDNFLALTKVAMDHGFSVSFG